MKITDEIIEEAHNEICLECLRIQSMPEECRDGFLESLEEKMRTLIIMMYRREEERSTK
jgi:hypothetical protein